MANYYNLTGWKHTGFDYRNRPYSRDVLNTEYFLNSNNFFQLKGIVVKRDDTSGLTYVDLQGSVKDLDGDQSNAPNFTGSQGPGGPFYSWEEVDYIRLSRTGYPGDVDFIDMSANQADPWNAPAEGKKQMRVGYYFVTGLQPLARNVTRLFLALDYWTTMGGADELEIETGFKIRGQITDAEDAANYYTAAEAIGNIHPLEVKGYQTLNPDSQGKKNFILSAADLTSLCDEGKMNGITVSTSDGTNYTIPQIVSGSGISTVNMKEPDGTVRSYFMNELGLYDPSDTGVKQGLEALYSAGQLELQDSYSVPDYFIDYANTEGGKYSAVLNAVKSVKPSIGKDITGYPRKADYMYGSMVLASTASGNQNAQTFADLTDTTIDIWANLAPSGAPYARFHGIKSRPFVYDQSVKGMTWAKNAIVLSGASGSMWSQINYDIQQGNQSIARARNDLVEKNNNYKTGVRKAGGILAATAAGVAGSVAGVVGGIATAAFGGLSAEGFGTAVTNLTKDGGNPRTWNEMKRDEELNQARASQQLSEVSDAISNYRDTTSAPFAEFMPDIGQSIFAGNEFVVYTINTDADDRARLKHYFRRYGYSGLYKPLTWANIHVKTKVNFVQAEGVVLKHAYYPMRDTMHCAELLTAGLFLWNERPNQSAFETQTDA